MANRGRGTLGEGRIASSTPRIGYDACRRYLISGTRRPRPIAHGNKPPHIDQVGEATSRPTQGKRRGLSKRPGRVLLLGGVGRMASSTP